MCEGNRECINRAGDCIDCPDLTGEEYLLYDEESGEYSIVSTYTNKGE